MLGKSVLTPLHPSSLALLPTLALPGSVPRFSHLLKLGKARAAVCSWAAAALPGATHVARRMRDVATFRMAPAAWERCTTRKARASSPWFLW